MKYCEKLKRKLQREKEKARKEEAMETLQERQKAEALKRMAILKLLPEVSAAFEQGIVYYSERQNAIFDGILYFVNNEKKYVDIVKAFESEHKALVYHAHLMHHRDIGEMLTLLYVSKHEAEWAQDKQDLQEGYPLAYVANLTASENSEFGSVGIIAKNGGVSRTY